MSGLKKLLGLFCVLVLSSTLLAAPKAWVSTSYRPDFWSSGTWYRAPVTEGYMDLRLAIENATFDHAEFSISYDSSILQTPITANFLDIMPGLSISGANTIDLDGSWKKTTFTFSGAVAIGEVQYESEAVFRLRLVPHAEGTVPVSLWTSSSPRYPDAYKTCDLTLRSGGEKVSYERKEWNDSVQLFTFTDKTSASVMYHYDLNLGTPISNGIIRITYDDSSVEEFTASNHDRGITIDSNYGGYYITAQPNAVQYAIIFPEYEDAILDSISGGWSTSHIQPEMMFFAREASGGFHGLRATSDDIELTVDLTGIGSDFGSSVYDAVLMNLEDGIIEKSFAFDYINHDTIKITIAGGLEANPNYVLYLYKNGLIAGRTWFGASNFYAVTFTVKDLADKILSGATVTIPQWGMSGPANLEEITDENGEAVFELPGSEWGNNYNYYVVLADHEDAVGNVQIVDAAVHVPVVMGPIRGLDMDDFAILASQWAMEYCQWSNDCNGADRNRDGTVDMDDLAIFVDRWLKDMN
ncbi:MAG: Ig-like domain-containing protein [Sedimentisphaerales bacterium]|nr:Ig-like domain-containing protein [Sedimentisphaerales bacterium]